MYTNSHFKRDFFKNHSDSDTRVQMGLRKSDPIARPRHCTTKKKVALREMCRSWPRVMHDPLLSTP